MRRIFPILINLIHRHRLAGKRALSIAGRILPRPLFRRLCAVAEQVAFRAKPEYQGDSLPPIFHYWSGRYLAPDAEHLGIYSPEQFYFDEICKAAGGGASHSIEVLSLGSGACSMEIALSRRLIDHGILARVTCVDFNSDLLRQAAVQADTNGLSESMQFLQVDCNQVSALPASSVIIVNQFFHHVESLEQLCRAMKQALIPTGRLLTSDIIGRNGHLLWPDVLEAVRGFWDELPERKHFDRYFGKVRKTYQPVDHSAYSNEGVRAQDIVQCLLEAFDFELFFTFGGCIMPFVERRIGFNFDPTDAGDRLFIDRVQAEDVAAMAGGKFPASNMIASLRHKGSTERTQFEPVSPEEYLRVSRMQKEKLGRGG